MASILIPLAEDFEDIEAITLIDLFRRAGFEVVTAGLDNGPVRASRGTVVLPDTTLDRVVDRDFDLVVLPGGLPGADHLNADSRIHAIVERQHAAGRLVAAICAAPRVLAKSGLLQGRKATSYPGTLDQMPESGAHYTGRAVEVDGNIVTSRGPGTAMDFALTLIEMLDGKNRREAVEGPLLR